ncbi:MAG TPA: glycosyltransferase family A protein [Chloroflexota bacterium]|nr:glycosyltransferase family A protein [Chloroflexota bacterium]
MRSELVSVIMPAFNAEQYIAEAIESLLRQSYADWELIIVDDGSTDQTAVIISQFTDARIKVIHQPNQGEAAARNTALGVAEGEFLAYLDDLYLPDHLAITVRFLQSHPEVQGVYTDGFYCDSAGNQIQSLSSRRRGPFQGRIFEEVVRGSDVFGPPLCVVLRREPILQYQLAYDTNIIIGPDWDFFVRYAEVASFGYVDAYTCLYRVHQTNITTQIKSDRRALELAKCRLNAIKLAGFKDCSVEIRAQVFYDLLVHLLRSVPERQEEIIAGSEFADLPPEKQAWVLRMMASKAVLRGEQHHYIQDWFRRSSELDPGDRRSMVVSGLYQISPPLCRRVLRIRTMKEVDLYYLPPFADLQPVQSS